MEDMNYRSAMVEGGLLAPLLNCCGVGINNDGILQRFGTQVGLRYEGKYLYVPLDGADQFARRESTTVVTFKPFQFVKHMGILADLISWAIDPKYRITDELDPDDNDAQEYTSDGVPLPIVKLNHRGKFEEDKLPRDFSGIITEMYLRHPAPMNVIYKGIDPAGDTIFSTYRCLLNACMGHILNILPPNTNVERYVSAVKRYEKIREDEYEAARHKFATTTLDANAGETTATTKVSEDLVELPKDFTAQTGESGWDDMIW